MTLHERPPTFSALLQRYRRSAPWWDDPEQAEVEAQLAAWKARESHQPECGPLGAWVAGQVAHALREARRQAVRGWGTRTHPAPQLVALEQPNEEGDAEEWIYCPASLPEEQAVARVAAQELASAVACLPKRQRQAVEGLYLRGLTYAALAREAGVSEHAVVKWRAAALARLRAEAEHKETPCHEY